MTLLSAIFGYDSYRMTFCKDFQKYGLGIICGSGLGPIADQIDDPICLDYNEIPHLQKIGLDFRIRDHGH